MSDTDVVKPEGKVTPARADDARTLQRAQVAEWLAGADLVEEDDTPDIDLDEAIRILGAANQDEVLRVNEMRKIDEYADKSFAILSVMWRKSTRTEDGAGRYAVLRCVDGEGEEFLTTCGATKVILQVRSAELKGWLPWQVQLQVTKTESNRTVKELIAPERPF